MRIAAMIHAVKVLRRKGKVLIPVRWSIRAKRLVLIAKRSNVCIIVTINAMPNMWISKAAAHVTVTGLSVPLSRKHSRVLQSRLRLRTQVIVFGMQHLLYDSTVCSSIQDILYFCGRNYCLKKV